MDQRVSCSFVGNVGRYEVKDMSCQNRKTKDTDPVVDCSHDPQLWPCLLIGVGPTHLKVVCNVHKNGVLCTSEPFSY